MIKAEITKIDRESIAEELDIKVGDCLLKINGKPIRDIIEYENSIYEEEIVLEILKKEINEIWEIEVEKDRYDELGMEFDEPIFDSIKTCKNNCLFCFVSQLPKGLRKSLYIKDEDYRLSYLYGSYTTLSNLKDEDYDRIINEKISPLYISVHAIDVDTRKTLLRGRNSYEILSKLIYLKENGIEMITQAVIVPGINDREILDETIETLLDFFPNVKSLTVVPVGLTKFHKNGLRLHTQDEAKYIVETVMEKSEQFKLKTGTRFVFLADEFFIKAGVEIPDTDYYEDFEHLENGVGLVRIFLDEMKETKIPKKVKEKTDIITGLSFYKYLYLFLGEVENINIIPIKNNFFGEHITVTGLLTGIDIIKQVKDKLTGKKLVINKIMLNKNGFFLDNMNVKEVENELSVKACLIENINEIF